MRGVKDEYRELDYLFAHESEELTGLIAASYAQAQALNPLAAQVAERRYRKGEHRVKTCRELYISEAQYYKLLGAFLRIAQNEKTAR